MTNTYTRTFSAHERLLLEHDIGCDVFEWIDNLITQKLRCNEEALAQITINEVLGRDDGTPIPGSRAELAKQAYLRDDYIGAKVATLRGQLATLTEQEERFTVTLTNETDEVRLEELETALSGLQSAKAETLASAEALGLEMQALCDEVRNGQG